MTAAVQYAVYYVESRKLNDCENEWRIQGLCPRTFCKSRMVGIWLASLHCNLRILRPPRVHARGLPASRVGMRVRGRPVRGNITRSTMSMLEMFTCCRATPRSSRTSSSEIYSALHRTLRVDVLTESLLSDTRAREGAEAGDSVGNHVHASQNGCGR